MTIMKKGKVYLVGAGPGDVKLLTIKGKEALQKADVIVYDRLANPKLLEFTKPGCELIYGGKLPNRHIMRQDQLNHLLVEKALEGKTVVRLKGGDPSVFGRVGEEAEELAKYDIPFEIVPGITSGIAAPIYAGIPVTHREYGTSFAVVTAHSKSNDGNPNIDWSGLMGIDTIAFYMGISNLGYICENLIQHGKKPETPVILLQWGTYGRQKALEGSLATIETKAKEENFTNPAITLVGDIIKIREKINWFEKKAMFGRQILLARTSNAESNLADELVEQGADVIEFPRWNRVPLPVDEKMVNKVETYENIFFTSPDSINEFFHILIEKGIDSRKVRANFLVGSIKSMKALNQRGYFATIIKEDSIPISGLLMVGEETIIQNQWYSTIQHRKCDVLITSQKKLDETFIPVFKRMLEDAKLDTVIFPSSKSVQPFLEALKMCNLEQDLLTGLKIACLGEQTRDLLQFVGLNVKEIPEDPSADSLIQMLSRKQQILSN